MAEEIPDYNHLAWHVQYTRSVTKASTVLVVDDELPIRKLISVMLASHGYRILEAANGWEAVAIAEMNSIDLLITDMEMPGMTGRDLITALQERRLIGDWLLVTGNSGAIKSFGASLGSLHCLSKPFKAGQLLELTQALIKD